MMPMGNDIEVAIVDDHSLFRQGVSATMRAGKVLKVVAEGGCADEALDICTRMRPDVLLLDISMPGRDPLELLPDIAKCAPTTKVVMLTASEDEQHISAALSKGAKGYVLKDIGGSELVSTIISIHNGQSYVSPSLAAQLLSRMQQRLNKKQERDLSELTRREQQILDGVMEGMTNKEIANKLSISEKTVKHYMTTIMQKLHVRNRVEAVLVGRSMVSAC